MQVDDHSSSIAVDWDEEIPSLTQREDPEPTLAASGRGSSPLAWLYSGEHTSALRGWLLLAAAGRVAHETAFLSLLRSSEPAERGRALFSSLAAAPVEDLCAHPGEQILGDMLLHGPTAAADVSRLYLGHVNDRPSISAGVLRLLGRRDTVRAEQWAIDLVKDGLWQYNIEIREAAVRALEAWGGHRSVELLSARLASEDDPWLAGYIQDVIGDLEP